MANPRWRPPEPGHHKRPTHPATEFNSLRTNRGEAMEGLIMWGVFLFIGYLLYKSGKRIGSRKGYNVGLSRGRRRRR